MTTNDMVTTVSNNTSETYSVVLNKQEMTLREILAIIWNKKWLIAASTVIFCVSAILYALRLPDVYRSDALVAPVSSGSSLNVSGQLGGLAALAGVNLGGGSVNKSVIALEVLQSREFISGFIERHDLFIPLLASEGWTRESDSLKINPELYDNVNARWVRKVVAPFNSKPSALEAFDKFIKIYNVKEDKNTGMIAISIEHHSPYIAKKWVDLLIKDINSEIRNRDLLEAQRSISYLNEQISQTNVADVRSMLFSMIEEQTKTSMLAHVRDEYIFNTIDPAVVAERKSAPRRPFIVLFGIILGMSFGIFLTLLIFFLKNYRGSDIK